MKRQKSGYQLVRKLATGGMAEVFLAKSFGPRGFEKTLVLKRILPHLAQQPSFVEMFLSEAMLAARLTHPHIVQIFDFGQSEGAYYLAMEYVDGPSLRALIQSTSRQGLFLPIPICARLISQACEGLAFAHDFTDVETGEGLGLVHRDVSPDNILLLRQGMVKVADFGIAKAVGQGARTESGVVRGKLSYMPPEQLRAERLDRRADVYALGVVLYELLTNNKPYTSGTDAGLMHTILFGTPVPATHFRSDLPESLIRILERATATDREQRYPDCHAFHQELEEFIHSQGKPVTAPQIAQIVQKTTTTEGVPVQRPSSETRLPSTVSPLLTRTASPDSGTKTERDTQPGPRPWATPLSLTQRTAQGLAPRWSHSLESLRRRLTPENQLALGGVLFMLLWGALIWRTGNAMAQGAAEQRLATAPMASAAAPAPSALPPPENRPPEEPPQNTGGSGLEADPEPEAPSTPAPDKVEPSVSAPPKKRSQPPRLARAPVASSAKASLDLFAFPHAKVYVDGSKVDDLPLDAPLKLSVGEHRVEFVEAKGKGPRRLHRIITLQSSQRLRLIANFDQGTIRLEKQ